MWCRPVRARAVSSLQLFFFVVGLLLSFRCKSPGLQNCAAKKCQSRAGRKRKPGMIRIIVSQRLLAAASLVTARYITGRCIFRSCFLFGPHVGGFACAGKANTSGFLRRGPCFPWTPPVLAFLTSQVKRVIQGEAAGDLVLEEDLKSGGRGIPIGQEGAGAGLDGLDGRRPKGPYVRAVRSRSHRRRGGDRGGCRVSPQMCVLAAAACCVGR